MVTKPERYLASAREVSKRRKPAAIPILVKKAWTLYSQWIRLAYADQDGRCQCVTCRRRFFWDRGIQAGHYIHNRAAVKFELRNVHPQCRQCNGYAGGSPRQYARYLVGRYGAGVLDELDRLARRPFRWRRDELERMIDELRAQIRVYSEEPRR